LVVVWWLCWLPVVELMVGRPVMRVVVAEGHDWERKKREDSLQKKAGEKEGWFFSDFWTQFSPPYRTWSLLLFIGWKKVTLSS
jgi:hypothetical protein